MKEYNEQVVETLDDAGCIIANKNIIIDNLQARIAELEAENERLRADNIAFARNLKGKSATTGATYEHICPQLAAAQEEIKTVTEQKNRMWFEMQTAQDQLAKAEQRVSEACARVALERRNYRASINTMYALEDVANAIRALPTGNLNLDSLRG